MNFNYEKPWFGTTTFTSIKQFRMEMIEQSLINPIEDFVFRGISYGETYKLIPTALRYNKALDGPSILSYHPTYLGKMTAQTIGNVVESEFNVLVSFAKEANKQGLFIPNLQFISQYFFEKNYSINEFGFTNWYESNMLDIAALAQHYGLPTRMLDWTYDINVALLFALHDRVKDITAGKSTQEPFSIWGIKPRFIKECGERFLECYCPIKFHYPSYNINNNVRAQKGILCYEEIENIGKEYSTKFVESSIAEKLLNYFEHLNKSDMNIQNDGLLMFKMNFIMEDYEIIRAFEDMTKTLNVATIFPDYNGVVQKMKDEQMIRGFNT